MTPLRKKCLHVVKTWFCQCSVKFAEVITRGSPNQGWPQQWEDTEFQFYKSFPMLWTAPRGLSFSGNDASAKKMLACGKNMVLSMFGQICWGHHERFSEPGVTSAMRRYGVSILQILPDVVNRTAGTVFLGEWRLCEKNTCMWQKHGFVNVRSSLLRPSRGVLRTRGDLSNEKIQWTYWTRMIDTNLN